MEAELTLVMKVSFYVSNYTFEYEAYFVMIFALLLLKKQNCINLKIKVALFSDSLIGQHPL